MKRHALKYPLDKLAVDESFKTAADTRNRLAVSVFYYGKRNDKKFTIQKINNETIACKRVK